MSDRKAVAERAGTLPLILEGGEPLIELFIEPLVLEQLGRGDLMLEKLARGELMLEKLARGELMLEKLALGDDKGDGC